MHRARRHPPSVRPAQHAARRRAAGRDRDGLAGRAPDAARAGRRGPRPARWPAARWRRRARAGARGSSWCLLDGASLDIIAPAAAQGRLPHFARLLEARRVDARGDAEADAAEHRCGPPRRPASCPSKNGVRSAATYYPLASADGARGAARLLFRPRAGAVRLPPRAAPRQRRPAARPLWSILSSQGVSVGVVELAADPSGARRCSATWCRTGSRGWRSRRHRTSAIWPETIWPRDAVTAGGGAPRTDRPVPAGRPPARRRRARRRRRATPTGSTTASPPLSTRSCPRRFLARALRVPGRRRPLLPALHDAGGVRRRVRRRAQPSAASCTRSTASPTACVGRVDRRAAARAICCWSCRDSAWSRSTPASGCSSALSAIPT